MNASGKQPQRSIDKLGNNRADSLADTEMAMSSGAAFERTELSGRQVPPGAGTLTDSPSPGGKGRPRTVGEIERNARYEIQGEHARGGLGRVLKARDTHLGRTVAIKELLEANPFAESLFIREALITGRLQHPGIVPVHEAGRWPSGDPYYVMKLLSGESLQSLIRKHGSLAERMALLPNVLDVVETIAYAHSLGIIHRDIKPANVVVGEFGETVVVDWGLARDDREPVPPVRIIAGGAAVSASFEPSPESGSSGPGDDHDWQISGNYSVSGRVVGTPAYMSPEQARGDDVDERTDVYALGALMYEVLAGRPPYPGDRLQDILERVLAGPPVPLAECLAEKGGEVQPDLITIVERAMARERDDRYPSAKELAEDLRRFQTGQLVSVHQYKTWTLVRRWVGRHRAPLAVAAVAVVLLAAFGVYSVNRVVEQKNLAQAQRLQAREARDAMAEKHAALTFKHAESALHEDPTSTLAWLATAELGGERSAQALDLVEQAVAMGVARHVLEYEDVSETFAYTPDGAHIVLGTMGGSVHRVDVATGAQRVLFTRDEVFTRMAISPDGTMVAIGTSTGALLLYPLAGDARAADVRVSQSQLDFVHALWFSSDGREVSARSRDRTVNTFRVADGELLAEVREGGVHDVLEPRLPMAIGPKPNQVMVISPTEGHRAPLRFDLPARVTYLRGNEGFTRVIAITEDHGLYLLDTADNRVTRLGERVHYPAPRAKFEPMLLSRSGHWLATYAEQMGVVILWDLDTGEGRSLMGHQDVVFGLAFSPDERFLATSSDDTTVRIWDLLSHDVQVLRGHTDDVYHVAFSPTGDSVASTGRDRTLRIWPRHAPESQLFASERMHFAEVAFPGRDTVVAVTADGRMVRHHLTSGQAEEIGSSSHRLLFRDSAMSPDGRFVVTGNGRGNIELWNLDSGTKRELTPLSGKAAALTWAPDSSGLAIMNVDGGLQVWLVDSEYSATLADGSERCSIALAPRSEYLAVISGDRIEVYDTRTRSLVASTPFEASQSCSLYEAKLQAVYSPDGQALAVAYPRRGIMVWNAGDHTIREYPASPTLASVVAFSPDSSRVASFHHDLSIHLVDLRQGTTRRLGYHRDLVFELLFSPDSNTLASASYDRTIRLWDTNGIDHRTLRGHSHGVVGVAFSPDGHRLSSVSYDRTLRIWDLDKARARDEHSLHAYIQSQTTATVLASERARSPTDIH